MKANLRALLRIQRIMAWRTLLENLGATKSKWGILLLPLALISAAPLIALFTVAAAALYTAGKALGEEHLVLVFALTAGQLACLAFGVVYIISAFYYSTDLRILVPMPIRPGEIVLAKFLGVLAGEYLTMAPLVLPALVIYGLFADPGLQYILYAPVIFLLLPIFPLVLSALFSLLLMRVTNLRRNRDLWRVIGALVGIGLALGFQFLFRMGGRGSFGPSAGSLQHVLEANASFAQAIYKFIPTSLLAANALRAGAPGFGAGAFLLFVLAAAALLLFMLWAAERLFFGGLVGGEENRASGRVITEAELARETATVRRPLVALLQREIRLLNRTPSFFMAAVLPVVLMPLLFALPALQDGYELAWLLPKLKNFAASPLVPLLGMGAVLLLGAMSNLAPTAISREGRYFWISRSLPIAPRLQIQAKLIHSLIFSGINTVLIVAVLAALGLLRPLSGVYVLLGGLVVSIAGGYGGIMIDLIRPNLKWTDPQKAIKGNVNGLLGLLVMLVMLGLGGAVSAVGFLLIRPLVVPLVIVTFGLTAFGLGRAAERLADRRYLEYED